MFTVRIWDLPTRLFHWILAGSVVGLVITGNVGGEAMVWHFRFGYTVLTLLLFRLVWGFWGGHWSRWAQLPLSPSSVWAYLKGRAAPSHLVGHNPLGSWSVVALLFVLGFQVATGLVSDDEIATMGPLSHLVSNAVVAAATAFHTQWGKLMILGLVVLHLGAVAWHSFKGHKLVGAMVHGDKTLPEPMPASRDDARSRLAAAILLGLCGAASAWVFSLAPAGV